MKIRIAVAGALGAAVLSGALLASPASAGPVLVGYGPLCNARGNCLEYTGNGIGTVPERVAKLDKAAQWRAVWYRSTSWNFFDPKTGHWNFQWASKHLNDRMLIIENAEYSGVCAGTTGIIVTPQSCSRDGWILGALRTGDQEILYAFTTNPDETPSHSGIPWALTILGPHGVAFLQPFNGYPTQRMRIP